MRPVGPDQTAFVKMMTHDIPPFLGGWCLIGLVAATMSTSDGAVLALVTVVSNNLLRHFNRWFPKLVTPNNLLLMARAVSLPLTMTSTAIAAYYRTSKDTATGATGSLLIVAFDILLQR